VSLVRRADGSPDYFISVAEDENERKVAEEALRLANRELASTTYAIAHDLRSPLRAIDGYSYLLLASHDAALDDEAREQLRRVRATSRRMGELLDGLLALARIARDAVVREAVDVGALARAALGDLASAEPGRRVEARVAEGIEAHADRRLLALAMENLVGNAWKFSAGRDPAVIEVRAHDAGGERVFAVRDNGVGFDMAQAGLLFRPFHRLHRDDEFAGHGLGLATVQRIVERHGGRVWAEGAPGAGATVYFTLEPPVASAASPDESPRETARD
jgi:light-regulated signal transduction histidine kinase (bacteriophytochrome)